MVERGATEHKRRKEGDAHLDFAVCPATEKSVTPQTASAETNAATRRQASSRSPRGGRMAPANLSSRPSTKALLMDVAEVLIGRYGVEGVSLRDIGASAGQANSNVVQYHFESKVGLISAVIEDRVARNETLLVEMLKNLESEGEKPDLRRLFEILWTPLLSFPDENGRHPFCHFILQCRMHPDFYRDYVDYDRYQGSALIDIMKLFQQRYRHLPEDVFDLRMSALSLMFVSCIVQFDKAHHDAQSKAEFNPSPFLDMAVAAMGAPCT